MTVALARLLLKKKAALIVKEAADAATIAYAKRMRARRARPVTLRGANGRTVTLRTPAEYRAYGIPENPTAADIQAVQSGLESRTAAMVSRQAQTKARNMNRFGPTRQASSTTDTLAGRKVRTADEVNQALRKGRYRTVNRTYAGYGTEKGPLGRAPQTTTTRSNEIPEGYKPPVVYARGSAGELDAVTPEIGRSTPSTAANVGVEGGQGLRFQRGGTSINMLPGRAPSVATGKSIIPVGRFNRLMREAPTPSQVSRSPADTARMQAGIQAAEARAEQARNSLNARLSAYRGDNSGRYPTNYSRVGNLYNFGSSLYGRGQNLGSNLYNLGQALGRNFNQSLRGFTKQLVPSILSRLQNQAREIKSQQGA